MAAPSRPEPVSLAVTLRASVPWPSAPGSSSDAAGGVLSTVTLRVVVSAFVALSRAVIVTV